MASKSGISQRNILRRNMKPVIFLIIVVALSISYYFISHTLKQNQALDNLYQILQKQGYQPNISFSGVYTPGTVIQTTEADNDGKTHLISPPVVLLWGDDCFPNKTPVSSSYTLPDSSSNFSTSLQLDAQAIEKFMPGFGIDNNIIATHKLSMENVHVLTFAKADLTQQFSDKCVNALSRSINEGDQIEWFSIINEAVVSDGLHYEIHWREKISAEIRSQTTEQIKTKLTSIFTPRQAMKDTGHDINLSSISESRSLFSATGPVILAYRVRPLQPVYEEQ